MLSARNVDANKSRLFLKRRPLFYRFFIIHVWYCVDWIANGGFDSFSEIKFSNELLDHQYVLTASCFHELLSNDVKATRAYRDLQLILQREVFL